jgi:hypothetical protein
MYAVDPDPIHAKGAFMKLSSALIQRTLTQFEAQPIPEGHPAVPQLNQIFGEHTFFLDGEGLHVIEPDEPSADGGLTGKVVKLADWKDKNQTSLTPCEPEATDVVVLLGPEEDPDAV